MWLVALLHVPTRPLRPRPRPEPGGRRPRARPPRAAACGGGPRARARRCSTWNGSARRAAGARPLRWSHPDAEGELPCYPVAAVDSTAAGDAFVGALLCGLARLDASPDRLDRLVRELPHLHRMLRFAAAAGALTVTRRGSFAAMPREDEVASLLEASVRALR